MFLFVIEFSNVIMMISDFPQSIFNFKTQHLARQMYRECRFLYRAFISDSQNCSMAIRRLNITGINCEGITMILYYQTSSYKPAVDFFRIG